MADEEKFSQAFRSFARKENVPSELTSDQWFDVPREIRERSFFMSRVVDAEILQRFRDGVEDILAGRKGTEGVAKELRMFLDARGYKAPVGKEGELEDLSSIQRIMVVLNTNVDMARGHARWLRAQAALGAFPVRRLYRLEERVQKRDWPARWREAIAKLGDATQAIQIHKPDPLAADPLEEWLCYAPYNDPIWQEISIFDNPYPPYDWDSGVYDEVIDKAEAKGLGYKFPPKGAPPAPEPAPVDPDKLTDPGEPAKEPEPATAPADDKMMVRQEPVYRSLNEGLQATPDVQDPAIKDALTEKLGRFGQWDGKKLIFTDPDGTRPWSAAKLAEIWSKHAPEGYDHLSQRDFLEVWDGGRTADEEDARVLLRRLFDRIVDGDLPLPKEVFRALRLAAVEVAEFIRGLIRGALNVPADVAAWDWDDNPLDALARANTPERSWTVFITVKGVTKVKDLRALRPSKPGFVYVSGTEFRVVDYKQESGARRINITLEEA